VFARFVRWPVKDLVGLGVSAALTAAILVNALFLQTGQHPSPIFSNIIPVAVAPIASPEATGAVPVMLPRPRPPDLAATKAGDPARTLEPGKSEGQAPAPRTRGELISNIQRELALRGFYDGPADGFYGAKTDAAIRDFEQAARLKPSAEPGEALLAAITRSSVNAPRAPATMASNSAPTRPDPLGEIIAPPPIRVIAVQRALSEYGYGQIKATGELDAETQAAIEKFERDRKLPVTGLVSLRVTRELAAVTGRPME
jgi:peptidoglycan hydrolase-like protein with peptidoglycan-binding domain